MTDKKKSTQDNFYKKVASSKGFAIQSKADSYSTIVQMIKSDLFQLQDMINDNSSEIKMHKLLSKVPSLTKKLSEIEELQDIKSITERITEESGNLEKLAKIYGCKSINDLSQKMALELNFYELFIRKLCDLFLLLQLKHCGSNTYQDTLSKILPIKTVIENLLMKLSQPEQSTQSSQPIITSTEASNPKLKEYDNLITLSTLNEVIDNKGENGKIFEHIYSIVNDYFNNLNQNIENMFTKLGIKYINNQGSPLENFFVQLKTIEDILIKQKEEIEKNKGNEGNNEKMKVELESEYNAKVNGLKKEFEDEINHLEEKIRQLQQELSKQKDGNDNSNNDTKNKLEALIKEMNEQKGLFTKEKEKMINDHNNELMKLKQEIKTLNDNLNEEKSKVKTMEKEKNVLITSQKEEPIKSHINQNESTQSSINEVLELIQQRNRDFELFKKEHKKTYENEISELTRKVNKYTEMNLILTNENKDLKKKLDHIQNKNYDADSYEQVLLGQFETMKKAFTKKIEDLTDDLSESRNETRVKVYNLQEELKEVQNLKDVFLKQVLQLQKQLNIN